MKQTEQQILEKAKKVLSDLQGKYYKEENILKVVFHKNDEVSIPIGQIMDTWIAVINEPVFDTSEFLTISDETGEPLYYQNMNTLIHVISKDENGNYY